MSIKTLARESFLAYCKTITPNFQIKDHHIQIARSLAPIVRGEKKRIIFSLPPRHGKTFLTTQHFPCYYLGKNPNKKVISTAYGQSLAEDFGVFVKNTMRDDRHISLFPDSQLDLSSKSKKKFKTISGGEYFAVGRGGSITGRGGDLIIVDDLIKNEDEARSDNYRKSLLEWWKTTLFTRLMPNGSILVVMTRWHEDDLIGHLLKNSQEPWEYIKYPAINDKGEALWPERYSYNDLIAIKTEMGSTAFEGQYQQEPYPDEGNIIKKDWIQRYKDDDKPKIFENSCIFFDLTFKGNKDSDFVVGQRWDKVKSDYYLTDMVRGQFDFTETLKQMKTFFARNSDCVNIVIEDSANASAVYSTIKNHISGVRLWKPQTSKESRLVSISPLFESKCVYIPDNEKYDIFVNELIAFPNASHDDTVDACTGALLNLKTQSSGMIMSLGERLF